MRLYAFDCLVLNGDNIMQKPLQSRFGVSSFYLRFVELTGSVYATGWLRPLTRVFSAILNGEIRLPSRE